MTGPDRIIRGPTAGAVVGVAAVDAVASYEHPYALMLVHGEAGWKARLVPFTVDGLILHPGWLVYGPGTAPPWSPASPMATPTCGTP
jgi:hypothetical protein